MNDITLTTYIQQLSKELNIQGTVGVYGNELELIALMRNCPFLYNKDLPDFRNIYKKNEAWAAIASVFGVSVGEAQSRWRTMRESLNKHKNNANHTISYLDDMKFLIPHITPRRTKSYALAVKKEDSFRESIVEESRDEYSSDKDSGNLQNRSFSNPVDVINFIEAVKNRPILYNHKHPDYKDKSSKSKAWKEIACQFSLPVKETLARWSCLRDKFGRHRRWRQMGVTDKSFEFYENLSFLHNHILQRRTKLWQELKNCNPQQQNSIVTSTENSATETIFIKETNGIHDINLQMDDDEALTNLEFIDTSNHSFSPELGSPKPEEHQIIITNDVLQEQAQSVPQNVMSNDEDILFGQTIAAELRRISNGRKKMKLKAEIYKLLYNEMDDD